MIIITFLILLQARGPASEGFSGLPPWHFSNLKTLLRLLLRTLSALVVKLLRSTYRSLV